MPADVETKRLRFVRAGLAAATIRGKSYLSLGNVSLGIAGSLVNHDFFESCLGMRVETVDMVEFVRRIPGDCLGRQVKLRGGRLVPTHDLARV
jgi:L-fucose isomerase